MTKPRNCARPKLDSVRFTTESAGLSFQYAYAIPRELENFWLQGRDAFGPFYVTGDGLLSEATFRPAGPNGVEPNTHFVADPVSPNRVWSTNQCGFSCFVRSSDSMVSEDCVCSPANAGSSGDREDRFAFGAFKA